MLSLIVAYDKNKSIGNENTIPWRLRADMLRVKALTTNQTIIMGRKTLDSIGRALPNRINRVLTKNPELLKDYNDIEIYTDDSILENTTTQKVFIFGGGTIYEKYFDKCDEMFITEVDTIVEADTKFPNFDENNWELVSREEFKKDGVYLIGRIVTFKDRNLAAFGGGKYAVWNNAENAAIKARATVTAAKFLEIASEGLYIKKTSRLYAGTYIIYTIQSHNHPTYYSEGATVKR